MSNEDTDYESAAPVKIPVKIIERKRRAIMGIFGVAFGLLGIFTYAPVFVPLALICSVMAIFMGQFVWAIVGLLLVIAGVLTSPTLLVMLGISALAVWLGIPV